MRVLRKFVYLAGVLILMDAPLSAEASAPEAGGESVVEAATEISPAQPKAADGEPAAETDEQTGTPEEVHERRMSQLLRLRDLAVENDRVDMISRTDGLIARELKRRAAEVEQAGNSETPAAAAPEPPAEPAETAESPGEEAAE